MALFKIILASVVFTFYFIEMVRMQIKLKLNFRPFNCMMCLSVWVSICLFLLPQIVTDIFIVAFSSGIIAPLLRVVLNNLYFNQIK